MVLNSELHGEDRERSSVAPSVKSREGAVRGPWISITSARTLGFFGDSDATLPHSHASILRLVNQSISLFFVYFSE